MDTTTLFNQNNSSSEFRPSRKLSDIEVDHGSETQNDMDLSDLPKLTQLAPQKSARSRLEDMREAKLLEHL